MVSEGTRDAAVVKILKKVFEDLTLRNTEQAWKEYKKKMKMKQRGVKKGGKRKTQKKKEEEEDIVQMRSREDKAQRDRDEKAKQKKEQPKEEKLDANELTQYLRDDYEVDIVVLAGYLRLIPKELCRAYENKMVNIHPSLLPSFGGKGMHGSRVHEEVLKSGARVTGPTVHFVNEEFDKGKIIAQRAIRINPSWSVDDLQREVLKEEHLVFPEVIKALCEERIEFRERDGVGLIQLSDGSFM